MDRFIWPSCKVSSSNSDKFDVTIVGGGMAGISCAWGLLSKNSNLKICILESNNRLGGRLSSFLFPSIEISSDSFISSSKVELGGAFLSGTVDSNPLWALSHNLELDIDDVKGGYD